MKPIFIGIAGGSGSGKSTFLDRLTEELDFVSVTPVSQDNYYKPLGEQQKDKNRQVNFDLPTAIDIDRFKEDLIRLRNGESISKTEYTFNNSSRDPKQIVLQPAEVILVEGLFIFHLNELRKLFDLTVYIEVDEEVKLQRRIKRDAEERGYDKDVVLYQWHNHVVPAFNTYLLPYKNEVDLIVENNGHFQEGLKQVKHRISQLLSREIVG